MARGRGGRDDKLCILRTALERRFGVLGISDTIIYDGGLSYNEQEWQKFGREVGTKLVRCRPEHSQSNGIMVTFNVVLVKMLQ